MSNTFPTSVEIDNQLDDRSSLSLYSIDHDFEPHAGDIIDNGLPFPVAATILKLSGWCRIAPQGQDFKFRLLKNDVEVGDYLVIREGETSGEVDLSGVDYETTDELGIIIKQVAQDTTALVQDLRIRVHYKKTV